jgi:hypothetical protein
VRRRDLVLLLSVAITSARGLRAQQKAMPVVGFLNGGSADKFAPYFTAFRNGLVATGYVEGQNVAIAARNYRSMPRIPPVWPRDPMRIGSAKSLTGQSHTSPLAGLSSAAICDAAWRDNPARPSLTPIPGSSS